MAETRVSTERTLRPTKARRTPEPRARGAYSAAPNRADRSERGALVAAGVMAAVVVVIAATTTPSRSISQPTPLDAGPGAVSAQAAFGAVASATPERPALEPAVDDASVEVDPPAEPDPMAAILAALDATWTAEPTDPMEQPPAPLPVSSRTAIALADAAVAPALRLGSDIGFVAAAFGSADDLFTRSPDAAVPPAAVPAAELETASVDGHAPILPRDASEGALRVLIVGDSLGNGLFRSMARLRRVDEMRASRRSRHSTGFSRPDYFDWNAEIGPILAEESFDAIVVYVGANDGQDILADGRRHHPGEDGWLEIYGERVDAFMARLAATGRPVYWVGLPITRSRRLAGFYEAMNEIFAESACRRGIAFVDVWDRFAPRGRFDAHGEDRSGRRARLRHDDGIHLSNAGYDVVVEMIEAAMAQPIRPPILQGASADACRR